MPFFSFLPAGASMTELWQHRPERMLLLAKYTEEVMRGDSPLSAAQRELIAAFVSGVNACRYCHGAHVAFAAAYGVEPALLEDLLADVEAAAVEAPLKPILAFCRKLTETPHKMVQADADAVFAAGWPEAALEDAIAVTGLFNLYNRLMDGHGIEPRSAEGDAARGEFIKRHGYDFSRWPEQLRPTGLPSGAERPKA